MLHKLLTSYLSKAADTIGILLYRSQQLSLQDYNEITNKWFVEQGICLTGKAIYKVCKLNSTLPFIDPEKIVQATNFIIHRYDEVEATWLMHITHNYLPILKQEVEAILNDQDTQLSTP